MNVGNNCKLPFTADLPKFRERVAVKHANTGIIGTRVEIVVVDRSFNLETTVSLYTKEESTGLMLVSTTSVEFPKQLRP
jgi:hypothetical protein